MQLLDRGEPRQPKASRAITTASASAAAAASTQPEKAETLAAREQILDQVGDAKSEAEQHQPATARPEHRAPAESRAAPASAAARSAPAIAGLRLRA